MTPGPPMVLGHRGAPRRAPENTVEAFLAARRLGADGVELDVRLTADGVLAVLHDAALPDGPPLVDLTLAEARALHPALATLEEALEVCAGIFVNVEVKSWPTDPDFDPEHRAATLVAELLGRTGRGDVLVSSFNPLALDRVREVDPGRAVGWLVGGALDGAALVEQAVARGYQAIHPEYRMLADDLLVTAAHDAGLVVNTWTVDDADDVRRLAAAGVDAIITNVPDAALAALGRA